MLRGLHAAVLVLVISTCVAGVKGAVDEEIRAEAPVAQGGAVVAAAF